MTVLTGHQIELARLLTLRVMLKLEIKGMSRSKGPSAYAALKTMGFEGTRTEVLAKLDTIRNEALGL